MKIINYNSIKIGDVIHSFEDKRATILNILSYDSYKVAILSPSEGGDNYRMSIYPKDKIYIEE